MADHQINLLDGAGHIVSSLNAGCADNPEALGLAQRMLDGRGHADVWAGAGRVSQASDADVEAPGRFLRQRSWIRPGQTCRALGAGGDLLWLTWSSSS